MPRLLIMVGNIASGKSMWIQKYLQEYDNCMGENKISPPIVLSKDAIRKMMGAGKFIFDEKLEGAVADCLVEMMRIFMFQKTDIIYDETNMRKQTRYKSLNLARSLGYEAIAVVMPIIGIDVTVK